MLRFDWVYVERQRIPLTGKINDGCLANLDWAHAIEVAGLDVIQPNQFPAAYGLPHVSPLIIRSNVRFKAGLQMDY